MGHILLVDDDDILRRALLTMLRHWGHFVTEAENGRVACKILQCAAVDVVLTDIVMPELDGVEIIIEVTHKYPGTRVIAMSGQSEHLHLDLMRVARGLGAKHVLAKPFTNAQLRAAIDASLSAADHIPARSRSAPSTAAALSAQRRRAPFGIWMRG
jgi:CheY-like chemotaxis protein